MQMSDLGAGAGASGRLLGGGGRDTLEVSGGSVGGLGSGLVSGGDDEDWIRLVLADVGGGPGGSGTLAGDQGDDVVALLASRLGVTGSGSLLGGDGDDTVTFDAGSEIGANGQVRGEAGNDRLRLDDTTTIAAGALLDGGADTDELELFGVGTGTFDQRCHDQQLRDPAQDRRRHLELGRDRRCLRQHPAGPKVPSRCWTRL